MSYSLSAILALGAGNTGLTLTASLFDSANTAAAGLTTSTLAEVTAGSGTYVWTGTLPDGHRGYIRFDSLGTFKSAVSINPQETENADIKTSTIAASVSAVFLQVSETSIVQLRGDTWSIVLTDLGSMTGNSKVWFTIKGSPSDTDAEAILQVEKTAGLIRLNGSGTVTASDASLVVDDATVGDITVTVKPAATAVIDPGLYQFDVQMLVGAVITTLALGRFECSSDISRVIA